MQDKVFHMPRIIINVILYIPNIVDTPLKRAHHAVFLDILIEKISMQIGYEATVADI